MFLMQFVSTQTMTKLAFCRFVRPGGEELPLFRSQCNKILLHYFLDKTKKKVQTPENSGSPRSQRETPKSFIEDEENDLDLLTVRDEDLLAVS